MMQVQVSIANMPVNLVLNSEGSLAFIRVADFKTIFDQPESGINAVFNADGFSIEDEKFVYNQFYQYKQMPQMLEWLKQQNMEL